MVSLIQHRMKEVQLDTQMPMVSLEPGPESKLVLELGQGQEQVLGPGPEQALELELEPARRGQQGECRLAGRRSLVVRLERTAMVPVGLKTSLEQLVTPPSSTRKSPMLG